MNHGYSLLNSSGHLLPTSPPVGALSPGDLGDQPLWLRAVGEDQASLRLAIGKAVAGERAKARSVLVIDRRAIEIDATFSLIAMSQAGLLMEWRVVPPILKKLSPGERRIAALIAEGCPGGELAHKLNVSQSTLQTRRTRLCRKLKMNISELRVWCAQNAELL